MKNKFQEQFETMRDVIKSNVESVQTLLKQSEQLSEIICSLNESPENEEARKKLLSVKESITGQLNKLVEDTLDLYEAYRALVDKVFGK